MLTLMIFFAMVAAGVNATVEHAQGFDNATEYMAGYNQGAYDGSADGRDDYYMKDIKNLHSAYDPTTTCAYQLGFQNTSERTACITGYNVGYKAEFFGQIQPLVAADCLKKYFNTDISNCPAYKAMFQTPIINTCPFIRLQQIALC